MTTGDRVAPVSEEAEKGLLGAVLQDPGRLMPLLRGRLQMRVEWLHVPAHQVVWETLCEMWDQNRPIELLTVTERLDTAGRLAEIGGGTALERLIDVTPTPAHGEYYAEQVREKFYLRRILETARETVQACYEGRPAQDVVSAAMGELQQIGSAVLPETTTNLEIVDALIKNWERALDQRDEGAEAMPGLKTPFRRMNEIYGGLQPGLHFFGGKSSAGKTTLVINICKQFLADGHPGLMVQLDDTHEDVIGRMVSNMGGVSLPALAQGFAKRDALQKIRSDIRPIIGAMPLHVVEECKDVNEAAALAQYHQARNKIKWMVIDYVQVLDADGNARDDERIRLAKISSACKRLWKKLRIPLMVVSQTSRFKDHEDDGMRADMSDLYGASELFHAATTVVIAKAVRSRAARGEPLMPVEMAIDTTGHSKKNAVALHVTKNKHGPKDCMVFAWLLAKYFQFTETRWTHVNGIDRQMTWQEEIDFESRHRAASRSGGQQAGSGGGGGEGGSGEAGNGGSGGGGSGDEWQPEDLSTWPGN